MERTMLVRTVEPAQERLRDIEAGRGDWRGERAHHGSNKVVGQDFSEPDNGSP